MLGPRSLGLANVDVINYKFLPLCSIQFIVDWKYTQRETSYLLLEYTQNLSLFPSPVRKQLQECTNSASQK